MTDFNELVVKIFSELPYINIKPYSHNIISITLLIIENEYGEKKAIDAMKICRLDKVGWVIPSENLTP